MQINAIRLPGVTYWKVETLTVLFDIVLLNNLASFQGSQFL